MGLVSCPLGGYLPGRSRELPVLNRVSLKDLRQFSPAGGYSPPRHEYGKRRDGECHFGGHFHLPFWFRLLSDQGFV
jgi:hypothetical protein